MRLEKDAKALSIFASTTIEGNQLPLTAVKKILKTTPKNIEQTEQEIINYNKALTDLNDKLISKINDSDKPTAESKSNGHTVEKFISHEFICNIQKQVTQNLLGEHAVGKYRNQSVFVNNPLTGTPVYLPPNNKDVTRLMDELIKYLNQHQNDTYFLILAGIFHKQFVIIHPFLDGNGRTARLVTKALLAKMEINTFNLFSFENYYNSNIGRYFEKVGVVGNYYDLKPHLDFTPWLEYFTEGIVDEMQRVSGLLDKSIKYEHLLEKRHKKIMKLINKSGAIKDSDYAEHTNRSKASRVADFQRLIDLGLILRKGKGRATYYTLT
jgi:Fic family protein